MYIRGLIKYTQDKAILAHRTHKCHNFFLIQNNTESQRKLSVQLQSEGSKPVSAASAGDGAVNPNLSEGSLIQIPDPSIPLRYGTIKWIGLLPNATGEVAGIELVI